MSAWLCSENHIGMLAAYLARKRDSGDQLFNARETAKILAQENLRSLNSRYGDDPENVEYVKSCQDKAEFYLFNWGISLALRKPVFWIKQANCLDYQSCESDDYQDTPACSILREIVSHAIHELPGYDAEPWGVH